MSAVVDEVILVTTDDTCAAIKDVFEDTRSILEPAGALAIAGIKAYVEREGIQDESFGRDRLRGQYELRSAALCRRTRRTRRASGGGVCRDHSRKDRGA